MPGYRTFGRCRTKEPLLYEYIYIRVFEALNLRYDVESYKCFIGTIIYLIPTSPVSNKIKYQCKYELLYIKLILYVYNMNRIDKLFAKRLNDTYL